MSTSFRILTVTLSALILSSSACAQESAEELAKKLANPMSSLISLPFQNNSDYGIGRYKGSRNTMNVQPVIPVALTKDIKLIARWVQPIVTQNNITGPGEKKFGLADAVVSTFLSPSKSKNGFTWGAGPVFLVPVATDPLLSMKQFGVGPTAVALKQMNGWTLGALANQLWGVSGGEGRPKVNQMYVQPFLNYNWKSGAGIGGGLEWTQNWTAGNTTLWFIPTVSGLTSLGKQKVSLAFGPRFNLAAPSGGRTDMGWRAAATLLFPKE